MSKTYIFLSVFCGVVILFFIWLYNPPAKPTSATLPDENVNAATTSSETALDDKVIHVTEENVAREKRSFVTDFDEAYTVEESANPLESTSDIWWLSSGAYFISEKGTAGTVQGELSSNDMWRNRYLQSNALDTDKGYHPQNIFRLIQKNVWENYSQHLYFRIMDDHLSASPNRNASNGVLLFNRYQDQFNLYYVGIRVDGHVTVKKKYDGTYYSLAYKPFTTESAYDRDTEPNLLPKNTWIGLRSDVYTNIDDEVVITLYMDLDNSDNWELLTEAVDVDGLYGNTPTLKKGRAGIRTDFMDVEFDRYGIYEHDNISR